MSLSMKIMEVFQFRTGYTVFSGLIEGHEQLVKNCYVELLIDGKLIQVLEINGELLSDRKHPEGYRAITTKQRLNLTSNFVKQHRCELKEVSN